MRRSLITLAGLLLMAIGACSPWATASPVGTADRVAVSGLDHGGLLVLALVALAGAAWFLRQQAALLLIAVAALGLLLVTGYELPGSLLGTWAWGEADLAWGIAVAGLGALVVLTSALRQRSSTTPRSQEPRTSVVPSGEYAASDA